jgi:hypothetical protein
MSTQPPQVGHLMQCSAALTSRRRHRAAQARLRGAAGGAGLRRRVRAGGAVQAGGVASRPRERAHPSATVSAACPLGSTGTVSTSWPWTAPGVHDLTHRLGDGGGGVVGIACSAASRGFHPPCKRCVRGPHIEPETMVHSSVPTRWGADRDCNGEHPTRWGTDSFGFNGLPARWGATLISAGNGPRPDCPRVGGANHNPYSRLSVAAIGNLLLRFA